MTRRTILHDVRERVLCTLPRSDGDATELVGFVAKTAAGERAAWLALRRGRTTVPLSLKDAALLGVELLRVGHFSAERATAPTIAEGEERPLG